VRRWLEPIFAGLNAGAKRDPSTRSRHCLRASAVKVTVYAITSSRRPLVRADARGKPLRQIRVGTLTAIVADVRTAPAATPASLRRYHQTIATIAEEMPAVMPARFGTLMSEDELRFVLRARAKPISATLRRLRGRVQMTLRLTAPQKRRGGPAGHPAAKPVSGRDYLRALAAREREIPGFGEVRDVLRSWIDEERIERRRDVVSVYHLVPRRAAAEYMRTAAKTVADAGLRAIVSGPFPPYAFSTL
jgi:hypothetical protein